MKPRDKDSRGGRTTKRQECKRREMKRTTDSKLKQNNKERHKRKKEHAESGEIE